MFLNYLTRHLWKIPLPSTTGQGKRGGGRGSGLCFYSCTPAYTQSYIVVHNTMHVEYTSLSMLSQKQRSGHTSSSAFSVFTRTDICLFSYTYYHNVNIVWVARGRGHLSTSQGTAFTCKIKRPPLSSSIASTGTGAGAALLQISW